MILCNENCKKTIDTLLNIHVAVAVINLHLQCKEGHWQCLLYNKSSPPNASRLSRLDGFPRIDTQTRHALNIQIKYSDSAGSVFDLHGELE